MAAQRNKPGTAVPESATQGRHRGPTAVSELLADRAAAPSPFGDDQTFPLPVERLTFIPADRY